MYKLYAQWCNHIHWKKQADQEISTNIRIFLQISEKNPVYNASKILRSFKFWFMKRVILVTFK